MEQTPYAWQDESVKLFSEDQSKITVSQGNLKNNGLNYNQLHQIAPCQSFGLLVLFAGTMERALPGRRRIGSTSLESH